MYHALFKTPDGQSSLFFLSFGILTLAFGSQYPFGTPGQMGPGFFPLMLGALLSVVGVVVGIQALRAHGETTLPPMNWRALGAITSAVVLAAFLLRPAGLVVAIPVLVVVAALSSPNSRIVAMALTAAILTFMAWAIFIWGLGLRIPVWWG
jgi:hypothetical protein